MKLKLLSAISLTVLGLFLAPLSAYASTTYNSSYALLTSSPSSSNFINTNNALNVDGTQATSSGSTYFIKLTIPNVTSLNLPSDAVITSIMFNIVGTTTDGYIQATTIDDAGTQCISSLTDQHVSAITNNTFLLGISGYYPGCQGSFHTPTVNNLSNYGIYIKNGASSPSNIGIDYGYLQVSYTSASKDYVTGNSTNSTLKKTCGTNWLDFQDITCNLENWGSDLFNFFFNVGSTYDSSKFAALQTALNNKAPFAYIQSAFATDFSSTNAATSPASLAINFDQPSNSYVYHSIGGISWSNSGSSNIVSGFAGTFKTIMAVALWFAFLWYIIFKVRHVL